MGGGFFGDSVEVVHFLVKWVGNADSKFRTRNIFTVKEYSET